MTHWDVSHWDVRHDSLRCESWLTETWLTETWVSFVSHWDSSLRLRRVSWLTHSWLISTVWRGSRLTRYQRTWQIIKVWSISFSMNVWNAFSMNVSWMCFSSMCQQKIDLSHKKKKVHFSWIWHECVMNVSWMWHIFYQCVSKKLIYHTQKKHVRFSWMCHVCVMHVFFMNVSCRHIMNVS